MSGPTPQNPLHAPVQRESMDSQEGGMSMSAPAFQLKANPAAPLQMKKETPIAPAAGTMTQEELELTGQFDPATHKDFVKVEGDYMLRREVAVAWNQMQQAASAAGVSLRLVSATRNFQKQAKIWNDKWVRDDYKKVPEGKDRSEAIMEFSSMPGTSRHHWGTDIDINSVEPVDWRDKDGETPAGKYNKAYQWLTANAGTYGFCQTYDQKGSGPGQRATGYAEERWHWSYIPLAAGYQAAYVKQITNDEVAGLGFSGAGTAKDLDVVNNYVNSVSTACGPGAATNRPKVLGTATITASELTVRESPSTGSGALGTLKKDHVGNYYQEVTDAKKNVWILLEEGWIAKQIGTKEYVTLTPAAAPSTQPTTVPVEEKK